MTERDLPYLQHVLDACADITEFVAQGRADDAYQGAELDLLMFKGARRIGVEFKRADVPTVTRSMRTAIDDLKLDALYLVYPGDQRYTLLEGVQAVPLWALLPTW